MPRSAIPPSVAAKPPPRRPASPRVSSASATNVPEMTIAPPAPVRASAPPKSITAQMVAAQGGGGGGAVGTESPLSPGAHNPIMRFLSGGLAFAAQMSSAATAQARTAAPVSLTRPCVLCDPSDPPLLVSEPNPSDEIDFDRVGRAGLRQVKAGTLQCLVAWLGYYVSTSDQRKTHAAKSSEIDLDYADVFFTCFPRITNPTDFVHALRRFFDEYSTSRAVVCSLPSPGDQCGCSGTVLAALLSVFRGLSRLFSFGVWCCPS